MTFGIATLPIVGAVGAAIDFSHANDVKSAMQAALDSTALMLSRDAATLSDTALQTKAKNYFQALFTRPEATNIIVSATYTKTGGSQVTVNGSVDVPTSIMGVIGYNKLTVGGSSTARWGSSRLRVALALDNTLSMAQSGKMDALKSATNNLIDKLQSAATNAGDVYVSIVPFNTDVNIGSGNYTANWVSWTDWDEENGKCSDTKYKTKSTCEAQTSCSISGKNSQSSCTSAGTCSISGYSSKNSCESAGTCSKSQYTSENRCKNNGGKWTDGKWTAGVWTAETWTADHSKWTGCLVDREKSPTAYNTMNTTPTTSKPATLFPADQLSDCSKLASVMPQSYDWTALKNKVTSMTPTGSTNTTIGLVHGWQTLSDGAPYSPPAIKTGDDIKTQKIIIFLTDGENTEDRWNSTMGGSGKVRNSTDIDNRMKAACDNAKADNVTIFTVLVMEGNESLLTYCASPDDAPPKGPKYFKLTSAGQIATAFDQIGTSLTKLRVAK